MKGEQISDALQMLRDDTIEETGQVRGGKRKPARRRTWAAAAAAACLCVAVGLTAVNTVRNTNDERITAEKITEFSGETILGGSTKAYLSKKADDLQSLMWSPIRDNSEVAALPVYQPKTIHNLDQYADECTEIYMQGLSDALGISVQISDSRNLKEGGYFFQSDYIDCNDFTAGIAVKNDYGAVQAQYTFSTMKEKTALFDASVSVNANDEEILAAASSVLDVFNDVFGKNYEAQIVERTTDTSTDVEQEWSYVYAWESSEDPVQQMFSTYLDYVYIIFTNTYAADQNTLQVCKAWRTVNELEPISEENTPLLSLAEAEEELERGHIFLGHVCPVCVFERNEEMDFSDYDGVEIVYRSGMFYTYNIPYYAFYKQTGEGTFAVTYVPAVKVEGLEEYFKAQESWHG